MGPDARSMGPDAVLLWRRSRLAFTQGVRRLWMGSVIEHGCLQNVIFCGGPRGPALTQVGRRLWLHLMCDQDNLANSSRQTPVLPQEGDLSPPSDWTGCLGRPASCGN